MTINAAGYESKLVLTDGVFTIWRSAGPTCYPRSGNAHNPTPRYSWVVRKNGEYMGQYHLLRRAKQFLQDLKAEA